MGAPRRQRHPILLIVILCAVLAWLAGAIWALWDSYGLQAAAEWRLGQFLGLSWFGVTLAEFALGVPSLSLIVTCAGFGSGMRGAPAPPNPRPRWTHDLPLILFMVTLLSLLWVFLGAPPFTLGDGARFQVGTICFSTLMAATLLVCATGVARYGFPGDKPPRLDAARPVL